MDGPLLGYFFCRLVFMIVFGEFAAVTALLTVINGAGKFPGCHKPSRTEARKRDRLQATRFPLGNHVSWVMPMNAAITARIAHAT